MAESTSTDLHAHNGHGDHHAPRPRKPTRIDFLKPQLSDESVRQHLDAGSGVSRLVHCSTARHTAH